MLEDAEIVDELLLVRETIRFVFLWFGWRKWLHASGVLDSAWSSSSQIDRRHVEQMEREWLLVNSRRLWSLSDVSMSRCRAPTTLRNAPSTSEKVVALSEVLFGLPRETSCSLVSLIRSIMIRLLDLFPIGLDDGKPMEPQVIRDTRIAFARQFCSDNTTTTTSSKYTFDRLLRTFDDVTIVCMVQVLASCLIPNSHVVGDFVYADGVRRRTNGDNDDHDSTFRILLPMAIKSRSIVDGFTLVNLIVHEDRSDPRDKLIVRSTRLGVLDELRSYERATNAMRWWNISRNDVISLLALPFDYDDSDVDRSFNVDKRAVMVANFLGATRDLGVLTGDEIGRTLIRAMMVKSVAVYALRYTVDAAEGKSDDDDKERRSSHTERSAVRTLERMGVSNDSYFFDNSYERATALTRAVIDLAATDVTRDVNRFRLRSAVSCSSVVAAARSSDLVRRCDDDDDYDERNGKDLGLIMISTDVMLDSRLIRAYREVRSTDCPIEEKDRTTTNDYDADGLYLRHKSYRDLGILLIPAHASPVFDRVTDKPLLDFDYTQRSYNQAKLASLVTFGESRTVPPNRLPVTKRYLRMCLVFPKSMADRYSRFTDPAVIAVLTHDTISYFFPRQVENVVSGTCVRTDERRPDVGEFAASPVLAALLSIDPYGSHALDVDPTTNTSDLPASNFPAPAAFHRSPYEYAPVPVPERLTFFPEVKLWMIMRERGLARVYVRSGPTFYCPHSSDRGIRSRRRGVVPLRNSTEYDQWKVYEYRVRGAVRRSIVDVKGVVISESAVDSQTDVERSYVLTKDERGRNWLLYESLAAANVGYSRLPTPLLERLRLTEDDARRMTVVRLVPWYVDHYSRSNKLAPTVEKIVSKRVYVINGVLCFCEQMTKFVGVPKENDDMSIPMFADWSRNLRPSNFADYGVPVAAYRSLGNYFVTHVTSRVDDAVFHVPKGHFYDRVFRPIVEQRIDPNLTGPVEFREQIGGDFYVLSFVAIGSSFWFPTIRLLAKARRNPRLCYNTVPRHMVPLVEYFVRFVSDNRSMGS